MKRNNYCLALLYGATLAFMPVAHAENLFITLGASSELSATYGDQDLTENIIQSGDATAPELSVTGLNLDNSGNYDDRIEIRFSVKSSAGEAERLAAGYRFNAGDEITLRILSAKKILHNGEEHSIDGTVVSAAANNKMTTFTSHPTDEGL
ncbi:MAG: hypothetical protein AAF226_12775, partial [Verrucomicrobiota bacterium]